MIMIILIKKIIIVCKPKELCKIILIIKLRVHSLKENLLGSLKRMKKKNEIQKIVFQIRFLYYAKNQSVIVKLISKRSNRARNFQEGIKKNQNQILKVIVIKIIIST